MKSQIYAKLQSAPRVGWSDIGWTLAPALIWLALVTARPWTIHAACAYAPQNCNPAQVLTLDQPSLGLNSTPADQISYFTQNFSGFLGLVIPASWTVVRIALMGVAPMTAAAEWGTDLVILLQTVAWTGVGTETAHVVIQRARPFVYLTLAEPTGATRDLQNYTSFYSGHTSFVTAVMVGLFLMLLARGAPSFLLLAFGGFAQLMVIATAVLRVLAGRHFLTDVAAAAIAATWTALAVAILHRRSSGGFKIANPR